MSSCFQYRRTNTSLYISEMYWTIKNSRLNNTIGLQFKLSHRYDDTFRASKAKKSRQKKLLFHTMEVST